MGGYVIDAMRQEDWPAVRAIYAEGIATGHATFELEPPPRETWDAAHLEVGRLVARSQEGVIGWAALTGVSGRCVYAGVAEISVYVAESARGKGLGGALLQQLVEASEAGGIWTLQAGIFPENVASIRLHERCGFRLVGMRERVGRMHGVWRDVVLMERRSRRVGTD